MLTTNHKTFKGINKAKHTMICIEDVKATWVSKCGDKFCVVFDIGCNDEFGSEDFASEEEAIKFRNEVMGWETTQST